VVQVTEPVVQVTEPFVTAMQPLTEATELLTTAATTTVAAAAEPVVQVTEPVVQATEPVVQVTEPVVQATQPLTEAAQLPITAATTTVMAPVEPVVQTTQPFAQATQPLTEAAQLLTTAATTTVTAATQPMGQATQPFTTIAAANVTAAQPVAQATQPILQAATAMSVTGAVQPGTATTTPVTPATEVLPSGWIADSSSAAPSDSIESALPGGLFEGTPADPRVRLVPDQTVAPPSALAESTARADAASRPLAAAGSSDGVSPSRVIGIAALLGTLAGLLGLAAFRPGQIAPGLAALYGTGGCRFAMQSVLSSLWSGRCVPLGGGELSRNASVAGGAVRSSTDSIGGRGEAKGIADAARPIPQVPPHGAGAMPPSVALVERALSNVRRGPAAWLWGLLLAAACAVGALFERLVEARDSLDDRS
jgi:hypothetical protein